MKFYVSVLIILLSAFSMEAQLDCNDSKIISLSDTTILTQENLYFISGDRLSISMMIDLLENESLELYRVDKNKTCLEALAFDTVYVKDEMNEALLLEGYCFCKYCRNGKSTLFNLRITDDFDYYFKLNASTSKTLVIRDKKILLVNDVKQESLLDLELEEGMVINLDKIYFVGGSVSTLPQSYNQLQELLTIMNQNTTLVIQIEGHVNGLYSDTLFYNELSLGRALAIKDFLRRGGVSGARVKTIGYGNKQMVYPNPKTPDEMERNRRVEIRIVEL